MPERLLISDFTPGLHTEVSPDLLPPGATPACQNVVFDRQSLRVRPGRANHSGVPTTSPVLTYGIRGLSEFDPSSGNTRLLAVINDKVYATNNATQSFTATINISTIARVGGTVTVDTASAHSLTTGDTAVIAGVTGAGATNFNGVFTVTVTDTNTFTYAQALADDTGSGGTFAGYTVIDGTVSTSNRVRMAQYGDVVYLVDGAAAVKKLFGTTTNYATIETLTQLPGPTMAPTLTLSAVGGSDYLASGDYQFHFSYRDSAQGRQGVLTTIYVPGLTYRQIIATLPAALETEGGAVGGLWAELNVYSPYSSEWEIARRHNLPSPWIPGSVTCFVGSKGTTASIDAAPTGAVRNANVVTITTTGAHGFAVGSYVSISGVTDASFNGYFVIASTPASTTFTYAQVDGNATSGSGTASLSDAVQLDSGSMAGRETEIGPPPSACTLNISWQGRMAYVGLSFDASSGAQDTLYVSDLYAPETFRTYVYVGQPPEHYGTWMKVGRDGAPITGLGRLGDALIVFKERAMWMLQGNGPNTWIWSQVSDHIGCMSHESITQVGNALWWVGADSVYSFDGQGVQDVGEALRGDWSSLTVSQKQTSFAAFDPRYGYLVVFNDGSATQYPASTGYLWQVRTRTWTRFTGMPDQCLIYAGHANTPAIYGGDSYGTAGGGRLFRLFSGLDDEGQMIAWFWRSGEMTPYPGHYLDVSRVAPRVVGTVAGNTLTAALRINGSSSDDSTQALSIPASAGVPKSVPWRPALVPDTETAQIGVSGSSTAALEITAIEVQIADKGRVR